MVQLYTRDPDYVKKLLTKIVLEYLTEICKMDMKIVATKWSINYIHTAILFVYGFQFVGNPTCILLMHASINSIGPLQYLTFILLTFAVS